MENNKIKQDESEDKKEKMEKLAAYICIISFVAVLAYIFFAAFQGLWPYTIIGYVPLYIQLAEPWGLYLLYWIAVILFVLGLYFQKRSKEIIAFVFLVSISLFIIMLVAGTISI
ncbi:MAG: hypothetical protein ACTSPQ_19790 [Candidatus Helarchaeota archaeon]